jgi:L-ribulose-5-phosphate 3-epimerase
MDNSTSRRQFVTQSLAVTAAVGMSMPQVAKCAESGKSEGKSGSLKGHIYKAVKGGKKKGETPLAFFERLKELGFDGVESGSTAQASAYREATAKTGVRVHGLVNGGHWGVRLSSHDQATRNRARTNLGNAIKNCAALGGSAVLLVPGVVKGAAIKGKEAKASHQEVWDRSIAEVTKLLPLAAKTGVRVLIETVWNGFCYEPKQFRDYIDDFNSPWVGAYFDIGNMQKFAPAHEWIQVLGSRTVKLDVKDWGTKRGFCRLGEGDVNWDRVREELAKINFSGWATREGRDKNLEDTSKLIDDLLIG